MKKILFGIITFLIIPTCFAKSLNFRTNVLMFYEYSVNNQSNYFTIYTDNTTDNLLFTTSPLELPQYQIEYQKNSFDWQNIELDTQNKIKNYIMQTQNESDFSHQMFYYMNTQLLIWKTFHPELTITIPKNEEKLVEFQAEMEEKWNITPSWIHDYEITNQLIIEKQESFQLTSDTCEIKEEEENWVITNCQKEGLIRVEETKEEKMNYYEKENHLSIIEAGQNVRRWTFQIQTKEEPKIDSPIKENDSNPSNEEPVAPNNYQNIKIENVPNTKENNTMHYIYSAFLLVFFMKKRK